MELSPLDLRGLLQLLAFLVFFAAFSLAHVGHGLPPVWTGWLQDIAVSLLHLKLGDDTVLDFDLLEGSLELASHTLKATRGD